MKEDYEGDYLAVCGCGNVLRCVEPRDCTCRCGNYLPSGYFSHENSRRYVIIDGFRGEKIKCYQQ